MMRRFLNLLATPILLLPAAIVLALMVVIPLAVLIWFSFAPDGAGAPLSLDSYQRMIDSPLYARLAIKTLWTAGLAALITAAIAWCPAWALSRLPGRTRNLILLAVIIPYLTSYLLLIYSIFVVLGPGSPIMALLRLVGLASPGASILYSQPATIVMLVYENLPLMIFVLFSGMQRIDGNLLAAAGSLGAGRLRRMTHIVFPMAAPALVSALVMVFVPMGGAFVESQILGGPHGLLLGNIIADQMTRADDPSFGSALSILLLLGMLIITGLVSAVRPVAQWVKGLTHA
ncbi:ABC transporter permease [Acidisoma silvae]|uniref:ABC transporter permease n=1 Tax=Acidisoma silvae TaxID=2802396 RepID=A0A964DZ79_9PROT|nr:ABC transporter permease [Acidisoma silvae]MCB8875986.1 ABC transporter permease [Acidisoma silvae]